MAPVVKIQRGKYSRYFQLVRAWLSAASASIIEGPEDAIAYIDRAILQLQHLKKAVVLSQKGH